MSGGSTAADGSATSKPRAAAPVDNSSTCRLLPYLDRVSNEQAAAIDADILQFFVACRVPFLQVESRHFLAMLHALRPGYVARKQVPMRRQMAGSMLTGKHGMTAERVMAMRTLWCQRRKAVLVLDAWENVSHHHIVNLMAIIGDKAVFPESVYC